MEIIYSDLIEVMTGLTPTGMPGLPGTFVLELPDFALSWWGSETIPPPTQAELDEFATSPQYIAAWGARRKAWATDVIDRWANDKLLEMGVFVPYLFYTLKVANIALLLLSWKTQGQPEDLDPVEFAVIHSEAQAYRDAHTGLNDTEAAMTPADLLRLQQSRRNQMQQALSPIDYVRRFTLEKVKLAPLDEALPAVLEELIASLDTRLAGVIAGLQQ